MERKLTTKDWIGFICMVVGMFMAVLDIQIVASSLQEIQAGLSASQDEISWVQTSYLIAEVIIIPISGWLGRTFSTRIVFSVSCIGFTLMSLACALSWNLESMIVFRALQGLFGGSMIPTVFASIYILFPLYMRPLISVIIGLVVTIAPVAGPVLGGYLTDAISWHFLFLINVIPGIFVSIFTYRYVNFDQPQLHLLKNIDFKGIILIALCLGNLEYVLEEGTREGWLESTLIQVLSTISFVSAMALFYVELTVSNPIINLRAFRNNNFAFGCFFNFILGWGMFVSVYLMPLFLGTIKGLNSLQIGEYLIVTGAFQFLSAPVAGMLSKKIDLKIMLAFGFILYGIGNYLNSQITHDSGFFDLFLPQMFRGFSLMFCFLPINTLALATLPQNEVQESSSLYNLMRNLGGAIGLAVTGTWLQNWTKGHYSVLRDNVNETNLATQEMLETLNQNFLSLGFFDNQLAATQQLIGLANREAYIQTFNDCFTHIGLLFVIGLFIVPFVKNVDLTKPAPEGAAH